LGRLIAVVLKEVSDGGFLLDDFFSVVLDETGVVGGWRAEGLGCV